METEKTTILFIFSTNFRDIEKNGIEFIIGEGGGGGVQWIGILFSLNGKKITHFRLICEVKMSHF